MSLSQFPALLGQGFLVEKTPIWNTQKAEAQSGRQRRRATWSYPKWRFQATYEVLRDTSAAPDLRTLYAFFNSVKGGYAEFAFLDPNDNAVTAQFFSTGDGVTTKFQLVRTMSAGGFSFTEPVRAVAGTPLVYKNGVATTLFSIDDTGAITFATAPANGVSLTWTGQFMFHCTFDNDEMSPTQMMQQLWSLDGLTFTTVKL